MKDGINQYKEKMIGLMKMQLNVIKKLKHFKEFKKEKKRDIEVMLIKA